MGYPKKRFFKDFVFFIDQNVYDPAEDSYLIAENLEVSKRDLVLDVGTGCGILAILAAKKAKHVLAIDINPQAIKCAIKNAQINCLNNIDFIVGDMFKSIKLGELFSLILFNAPYLPCMSDEEKTWIGKSWAGGLNGREIIDQFINKASKFLTSRGKIFLVQSSLSDLNKTQKMFVDKNLCTKIVSSIKFPFESIILVKAEFLSNNKTTK
jgi:release factor glutamine methyltransferase